jgi:hypothetical protein
MSVLDQLETKGSSPWEKLNDRGLEGCSLANLKQAIADNPALKEKLSIVSVKPDGTPDVSAWKPDNQFDIGDGFTYKEKFTIKDNKPDRYQLIRWKQKSTGQPKTVYTTAMVASFRLGQEKELNEFLEAHLKTAPQRIVDVERDVVALPSEQEQAQPNQEEQPDEVKPQTTATVEYFPTIVYTAIVRQKVS